MPGGYRDGRLGAGDEPLVERRIGVVAGGIVFAFVVFILRLFQLQILEGADLRSRSLQNSVRTVRVEAPRGNIVDRNGDVIATARPAYRVQVIPSDVRDPDRTFAALGVLLGSKPEPMREAVEQPRGRERFQPVVLDGDLPYEVRARVESYRFALPGVITDLTPRRLYVEAHLAGHLLGTLGEVQSSQLARSEFAGYRSGEFVGQGGLESRLEFHLRGRAGGRNLVVDVMGREVQEVGNVPPLPGGRAVLTLDLELQRAAEAAFVNPDPEKPAWMGALVALDVRNGDVLALVSRPTFDPNSFAGGVDSATWARLTGDEWEPLTNRAVSGLYSPGSTYKAIVAAAGLSEGLVDPEAEVFCPGHYRLGRRTYRCWKRGGHGNVNLSDALKFSCDVFFYRLGLELGIDTIARYARGFGLGQKTGIRFPGEKAGLIPTREWKEEAKQEVWLRGETVSASIGQGYNLVSPMQLAVAYAAIANGGVLYVPRLVRALETWDGQLVSEQGVEVRGRVPVPDELMETVRAGLTQVVMGERGTGARARVRGITVAGKTGTTQVVGLENVRDMEDDEIPVRWRDHALFAAFAPVESPEIVVAVIVEHAGAGGGTVAAPIAQKVLARYFETRPPVEETPLEPSERRDEAQLTASLSMDPSPNPSADPSGGLPQ